MNTTSPTSQPPQPRFQFTVAQTFAAMAACGLFFGLIAWGGWIGGFFFVFLCGGVLLGIGISKRDPHYYAPSMFLLALAAFFLVGGSPAAYGVGHSTLAIPVKIVDTQGNPIDAANVCLREVDLSSLPPGIPLDSNAMPNAFKPAIFATSDAAGLARFTYTFKNTSYWNWFVDECHLHIREDLWIQIDAPGYKRTSFRLEPVLGRIYDWQELPFPTIKVRVEPAHNDR